MSEDDPHVHVVARVPSDTAAVRNVPASTFGLAGDLPGVVTTGAGCGRRTPRPPRARNASPASPAVSTHDARTCASPTRSNA
ncbi:hypothetical protein ACFYVW_02135 [Streptomyces tendae]|uniref:hypothetical protein n=1 Tax=Streptomyces tendae TaxID=1932 RepID=UPI0036BC3D23